MKSGIDISSMEENNDEEECIEGDDTKKSMQKSSTPSLKKLVDSTTSLNGEKGQSNGNHIKPDEEKGLLKELEASSKGMVKGSLILNYFKSAKRPFTAAFVVLSFLFTQLLANTADIFVSYW